MTQEQNEPTDELLDLAVQISMTVELHERLNRQLRAKVDECFDNGDDLDVVHRNSNLSKVLVEAWHKEWQASQPAESAVA